jgi:hypothetical protein
MNKIAESVLDDTSKIMEIDKNGMLGFCVDEAQHYRKGLTLCRVTQTRKASY